MFKVKEKIIDLGDGRIITLETGRMARQADGSVLLKMGKTMLLATVVSAREAKEDVDFMPLSVEYKEKYASSGRFPGGFLKREARASDYEILISEKDKFRLINDIKNSRKFKTVKSEEFDSYWNNEYEKELVNNQTIQNFKINQTYVRTITFPNSSRKLETEIDTINNVLRITDSAD